jgi:hypothetical protein
MKLAVLRIVSMARTPSKEGQSGTDTLARLRDCSITSVEELRSLTVVIVFRLDALHDILFCCPGVSVLVAMRCQAAYGRLEVQALERCVREQFGCWRGGHTLEEEWRCHFFLAQLTHQRV